ncbi:MAG: hypothetical protein IPJ69_07125 [Deltaproteobacteria bacterium]|nr:MAG: hypothetical protein IPJ69_07125 [Deltaproteobacteria bacterium]
MTDGDIVVATELTPGKIARYSKEIEKRLRAKNWRVLEDPSQGLVRIRKAAGAISKKFEEAFNKGSPSEAVIYLTSEEKRYEPNSEERRLLSLYKTCFENVVRIPGVAKPRRRSFEFIRQKTGSLYGTIRKYQIDVENRAKLLGWEVLPKPSVEKGASTDARFEFSSIILWAKENNESFETIQAELQSTIDELENENEKKALKRYVTLFNLINEDPRDIKLLFSIREWEDKIGTDYRTVYKSVKFIRECLRGL